jgi:hypothetical protein
LQDSDGMLQAPQLRAQAAQPLLGGAHGVRNLAFAGLDDLRHLLRDCCLSARRGLARVGGALCARALCLPLGSGALCEPRVLLRGVHLLRTSRLHALQRAQQHAALAAQHGSFLLQHRQRMCLLCFALLCVVAFGASCCHAVGAENLMRICKAIFIASRRGGTRAMRFRAVVGRSSPCFAHALQSSKRGAECCSLDCTYENQV